MRRLRGPALAAMLLLLATPLAAQRSARRVLDREAIATAGWHRMGDIASALPPGATASVDGFNHELRGSRLGFSQTTGVGATWLVRLNGQVVPMHFGGVWILDEIPVAITQLDSIVIVEGPTLSDGRAAFLGTIDLYTRRPRGVSLVGDYQHGDETGDPGPYRYTPRTSPNVEKLGPFTSGALAAGSSAVALDVAARYSSLNVTDQRIGARVAGYQSDVNASGGSGTATLDMLGGRTFVVAGRGRFTGFLPLAVVGGDQQARVVATHAGVSGSLTAVGRGWRYAISGTELEIEQLGSVALLLPDSRRRSLDGFVEGALVSGLHAGLGGNLARRETLADSHEEIAARFWLRKALPGRSAEMALERADNRFHLSYVASLDRAIGDADRLSVTLTALEAWRFAGAQWMDQGATNSNVATALDLRADLTTSAFLGARPVWYARGFRFSNVASNPAHGIGIGVTATTVEQAPLAARIRAEVTQLLSDIGPGERSTPGGFVEGTFTGRPAGGFLLSLSGRFAPATRWTGSLEDVPATRRIDFSVNKGMWRDRIRAQLVMRNLLNAEERSRPDGAQWNLRSHLAVTVALPSGASAR